MTTALAVASRVEQWAREWLNLSVNVGGSDTAETFERCHGDFASTVKTAGESCPTLSVAVTTHARVESATGLLTRLATEMRTLNGAPTVTSLLVVEDRSACTYPVASIARAFDGTPLLWLRSKQHLGKRDFWRLWQAAFAQAAQVNADYALFLQDDLEFDDGLLRRATDLMSTMEKRFAPQRVPLAISLHSARDEERFGRWVFFPRRPVAGMPLVQTQWLDLPAVLMNRACLDLLSHRVLPVSPQRFTRNPHASSGVGRQLTRRLCTRARIYHCVPSLVFHGAEPSTMNPEARQQRTMDNRHERPVASMP